MIQEQHISGLGSLELGDPKPKPTGVSGDPLEAARVLWSAPDGSVTIGVWECSPGEFTATREGYTEVAHIISGDVSLTDRSGVVTRHGPGDLVVTNEGWNGTWNVHATVRKLFIIHRESTPGQ